MSNKIKRIVVPVDFSETSDYTTSHAASMARSFKSELLLIHVIEFSSYYFAGEPDIQIAMPPVEELEMVAQKKMVNLQKSIGKQNGILPEVFITSGNMQSEVLDFARKKKADLIVMGTHGASGYRELFIGSNAQHLVTLSEIPVLTIRKDSASPRFKNILLPFDNSFHSREKVNIALTIAKVYNSKVHLLGLANLEEPEEYDVLKIKLEAVEKILREDKLSFITEIISEDHIAKEAMTYGEKYKCDLIVINTGHESKITGIFLGAFAQQIVNHSKIPVLSVKPTEDNYSITTPGFGID